VTVNPTNTELQALLREAASLLRRLQEESGPQHTSLADDLLLALYRLRDEFQIVESSSKEFRGPTFSFLNGLLYGLESDPEATMHSAEMRSLMERVLKALVSGAIRIRRKTKLPTRS
jgi:hypothetical protein